MYQNGRSRPQFWVSPDITEGQVVSTRPQTASTLQPHKQVVVASLLRPTGATGVQTHIREFIEYLDREQVPATLVTPFSWGGPLQVPAFGPRLLIDPLSSGASIRWHRFWHSKFLRKALEHILRDLDDTIVYAHCPVSAKAALDARRHAGQRVIMAVHYSVSQADEWAGKGKISYGGSTFRGIRELEKETLPRLDGIVFVSESGDAGPLLAGRDSRYSFGCRAQFVEPTSARATPRDRRRSGQCRRSRTSKESVFS